MHPAKDIEPLPEQALARIEDTQLDAGRREALDEFGRQLRGTEAVDHQVDLHTPLRRLAHHGMERVANLVLDQDEGFDDDFVLCSTDGLEHAWKKRLAVFEQLDAVAADPARTTGRAHSLISATSGAWSDRCDQGFRGSTMGACTAALRT